MAGSGASIKLGILLCLITALCVPFVYVIGIFFIYLQDGFNASAAEISFVLRLRIAVMYLGGPFYGALCKVLDPKLVTVLFTTCLGLGFMSSMFVKTTSAFALLYGGFGGIGAGLAYILRYKMSSQGFTKSRALVNNLLVLVTSLCSAMLAKVAQIAIDCYGWRAAMALGGAIVLNMGPIGWMASNVFEELTLEDTNLAKVDNVFNKKSKWELFKETVKTAFDFLLLKDPCFVLFCFTSASYLVMRELPMLYLVRSAQAANIPYDKSSTLLSVYFVACAISGFAMGLLASVFNEHDEASDKKWHCCKIRAAYILTIVPVVEAAVFLIPIFMNDYRALLLYTGVLGVCDGLYGGFPISIISDLFGAKRISGAMGFRAIPMGVFGLLLPTFAGYLVDTYNSYTPIQYVCIANAIFCSFGFGTVNYVAKNRKKQLE